ncbi:hypothetical protein SDD30_11815 [Moorella naiadis]|uniref:hypothetical protein n=1 Tax=Moorella naiadis (nom. illeg.) TaxID=3093670 RepID=UPI003D9C9D93
MLQGKLLALLKECPWLLEKTVEDPQTRQSMTAQVNKKIAALEGDGRADSHQPAGGVLQAA